jgi:hypothetical protein
MKQVKDTYPMADFPMPDGLKEVNVGGGIFGRGERYYLTPGQLALLDQEPNLPTAEDNSHPQTGKSIIDRFLDLFR